MPGFTPSRLVLARKRKGITKKELAEKAGISVRSLTAYEAELQEPTPLTLARLADALGFPVEFFHRPPISAPSLEGASFRALKRMTASQRDQAVSAGAFAVELSEWIDSRFHLPSAESLPRYRGVDAETAAQAVREEWGLGQRSVRNMIHLLEAHGVRVFSLAEESRDVDAFSTWRHDVPYIFLNTMKSPEHSRMDAAHELGHLVLHSADEPLRGRDEERDANAFGAAFLMPEGSIYSEAPRGGRVDDLVTAKRKWGVSVAALAYRLHKLHLLTDWQFRSAFIEISARGYRTNEPSSIPGETSQVLDKVFRALGEEGITRADVAQELALPLDEIQKLVFGLVMTSVEGGGSSAGTEWAEPKLRLVDG